MALRILAMMIALLSMMQINCAQQWQHSIAYQPALVPDQVIFTTLVDEIELTRNIVYIFSLFNGNQTLRIRKVIYSGIVQSSSTSRQHAFQSKINYPRAFYFQGRLTLYFITDAQVGVRYFFNTNLNIASNSTSDINFNGIYSRKHDIFYLKSNTTFIVYSDLNGNFITAYNVTKNQAYPIDYIFGLGQNILIKLFQGANFIEIRNMNNLNTQESYQQYRKIFLPNFYYQCFCINFGQNYLYILDNMGILIKIDLILERMISNIDINIFNQNKCFDPTSTPNDQIIFVEEINDLAKFTSFAYYGYVKSQNYYNNSFGKIILESKLRSFVQFTSTKVYLNILTSVNACNTYGFYLAIDTCQYCGLNCISCINETYCNTCTTQLSNTSLGVCQNVTNNSSQSNTTQSNTTQSEKQTVDNKKMDGLIQLTNLTQYQQSLILNVNHGISYSNIVLQKLNIAWSSLPFIYIFLGSINFFSICSLYAFINVKIPQQLYQILKTAYLTINNSIFSIIGLKIDFSFIKQQKVTHLRYLDLGLSSNFLSSNYHNIFSFIIVILLLAIMKYCSKFFNKTGIIHRLLNQNYSQVIIGVALSNIAQIILPYLSIFTNFSFVDFSSKTNLFVQSLFICIFLILIGFVISYLATQKISKGKKKKKLQPNKISGKQLSGIKRLKQQKQSIYFGFNNLIFGMFVVVNNPIYFLIVGQLFTFIGIYKACSYRRWKINRIIISLYPILFHLCFIIFHFSNNMQVIIWTYIVCIIVYLMGSFHEFLLIIAELVDFFYRYLNRNQSNKIVDINAVKVQQQNKEKNEKNQHHTQQYQNNKFRLNKLLEKGRANRQKLVQKCKVELVNGLILHQPESKDKMIQPKKEKKAKNQIIKQPKKIENQLIITKNHDKKIKN